MHCSIDYDETFRFFSPPTIPKGSAQVEPGGASRSTTCITGLMNFDRRPLNYASGGRNTQSIPPSRENGWPSF